jgi:hypothetical protein
MPLPPRPFHPLTDIAIRWSVSAMDIVGWATEGWLALSIAAPPLKTLSSRIIFDLVEVAATDVLPLFRPEGAKLERVSVRRIRRPGEDDWQLISEPPEGIMIAAPDILITRADVQRFEHRTGLDCRAPSRDTKEVGQSASRRSAGPGAPPRYEWDAFYAAIARRVHEHGIPRTQAELIREMLDWFQQRTDEHAPDESTVRRKVAVVWRELNRT